MRAKRLFTLASFIAAAALVLTACSGTTPTSAPTTASQETAPTGVETEAPQATEAVAATEVPAAAPQGEPKQVTIGWYQEPSAVVAIYSSQTFVAWLGEITNVGLWNYDENEKVVLELADKFPDASNGGISADGKTITYTLKPDLKWSDGQALTSADIKFTWQAIVNPENKGVYSRVGYDQIDSIDTPDPQTAVVTFKDIYAPWPGLFAQTGVAGYGLLPEHILKDMKSLDGSDFVLNNPITAGPYKVTSVVKGDRIELEATDTYWRGRPKIDKIFIKVVPDRESVLAGLRTGDLDVGSDFAESSIPDLESVDTINTFAKTTPNFEHYFFNLGTGKYGVTGPCPFQDVRVRQALTYGIDRFTIADKLLFQKTRVVAGLWPNSIYEDTSLEPYPYDPEKAKALLDEAGYKPGADGIREGQCGGQTVRLSFKHMTTSGNELRANVQTLTQQNLKDIGVEFIPDNKPSDTLFATYSENGPLATGQYDMGGFTTAFVSGGDPDPTDYFKLVGIPTQENPNGNNWYFLEDEQLDKLSDEQSKIVDVAKRTEIIKQMQKIMYDKAYVIPMYARLNVDAANKRITNVKSSATGNIFWNVWEWDVTE
ncbi:MAG: ABC transporter substrate-binding protein [Chloroflexi bacterium]|nr:ABC transporter substrate-binding protein [Chloroflexota bacterium]